MQIWHDEAGRVTPKTIRAVQRIKRKHRAKGGWFNWYINRRRMDCASSETPKQMRQVSWRRAH